MSRLRQLAGVLPCLALLFALTPGGARPAVAQLTGTLKVGLSAASFAGETMLDYTPRIGWTGSFGLGYDFGNGLAIVPELIYLSKGADTETTADVVSRLLGDDPSPGAEDVHVSLSRVLAYAEVPVLLVYRLETRTRFHPRIFAGPSVAYKLSARLRFRAEGTEAELDQADPANRGRDYGFVFGAGAEIESGSERLTFDVRAHLGRSSIHDADPPVRNTAIVFLLGLAF